MLEQFYMNFLKKVFQFLSSLVHCAINTRTAIQSSLKRKQVVKQEENAMGKLQTT